MGGLSLDAVAANSVSHAANQSRLPLSQRRVSSALDANGRAVALMTRLAERRIVRDADIATAVSEVDQSHFGRLYGIKPILLPNGVDTERFTPPDRQAIASFRAKYEIDSQTLFSPDSMPTFLIARPSISWSSPWCQRCGRDTRWRHWR